MSEKVLSLPAYSRKKAVTFGLLAIISAALPVVFSHYQFVSGPLVNAVLLIAAAVLSPAAAITIGLIPSTMALSVGLLPAVLAPMVPFIMISNAIYVAVFSGIRQKNFSLAVIGAAVLKFLFLLAVMKLVIAALLPAEIAVQAAMMMSWPQLATALVGGLIAHGVLKVMKSA